MTKEEMIEKVLAIKNVRKDKAIIYQIAKELGLKFKETNCNKCLGDYWAILKEELGIIGNASEASAFDSDVEFIYTRGKSVSWNGHSINQNTDPEIIKEFVKKFPDYYKVVKKTQVEVNEQTEPQQEETINNNE